MKTTMFGAIRKNDSGEFLVADEIACIRELVERRIAEHKGSIPQWHRTNPVQRIAKILVEEIQ
jgi:hypothetical protein